MVDWKIVKKSDASSALLRIMINGEKLFFANIINSGMKEVRNRFKNFFKLAFCFDVSFS